MDAQRTLVVPLACSERFRVTASDMGGGVALHEEPYLLYVGTRGHHKNFRLLLEAYSRWDRRSEVSLVVVGAPWSHEEMLHVETTGISDRVYLLSDINDERLCWLYNRAAAFVHPSLYEGFGIPLLEAMACGCPIIASRIPSTIEVARDCPIYFEPTESEDLIAAFDTGVAEGRDSARVHLGLELAERFSWDATARQTLGVYRALSNPD